MKKENNLDGYFLDDLLKPSYIKVGKIIIMSVAGLYLLGHIFKISAFTVQGFKQLKSTINA